MEISAAQVLGRQGAARRHRPRRSRCTARSASPATRRSSRCTSRARFARIYDGPDEVHRMVVARRILKSYEPEMAGGSSDLVAPAARPSGFLKRTASARARCRSAARGRPPLSDVPGGAGRGARRPAPPAAAAVAALRPRHGAREGDRARAARGRGRVPEVLAVCPEDVVLGVPFYLMELRAASRSIRCSRRPSTPRPSGRGSGRRSSTVAELHVIDPQAAGLSRSAAPTATWRARSRRFLGLWTRTPPATSGRRGAGRLPARHGARRGRRPSSTATTGSGTSSRGGRAAGSRRPRLGAVDDRRPAGGPRLSASCTRRHAAAAGPPALCR